MPLLKAFCEAIALPSSVLGPVALFQGCHRRIAADCFLRRAALRPFSLDHLQ